MSLFCSWGGSLSVSGLDGPSSETDFSLTFGSRRLKRLFPRLIWPETKHSVLLNLHQKVCL